MHRLHATHRVMTWLWHRQFPPPQWSVGQAGKNMRHKEAAAAPKNLVLLIFAPGQAPACIKQQWTVSQRAASSRLGSTRPGNAPAGPRGLFAIESARKGDGISLPTAFKRGLRGQILQELVLGTEACAAFERLPCQTMASSTRPRAGVLNILPALRDEAPLKAPSPSRN
jgi:hypothetical protein